MRVRIVLAVGVCAALIFLGRALRADAPAVVGGDRVIPAVFSVSVPPGRTLCQGAVSPPHEAAVAKLTIGTYGRPVPAGQLDFISATGAISAAGRSAAGTPEGVISMPLRHFRGVAPTTRLCLRFPGRVAVVLAGVRGPPGPGTAQIDGTPQPGVVSVIYYRGRRESWWSQLGSLPARFGRGKAAFFRGAWALPACILALVAVWIATLRLLARELR